MHIIRTAKGCTAYGRENIPHEIRSKFQDAIDHYSQILEIDKEYNADQWIMMIAKHYKMCYKTQAIIQAIREAMPHPITNGEL